MEQKNTSYLKQAVLQVTAGGSAGYWSRFRSTVETFRILINFHPVFAGFIEVCIMQPLDLVKTRLQIQRNVPSGQMYTGVFDCLRKMYQHEGFLSFYKGIIPPVLAETPKRAVKVIIRVLSVLIADLCKYCTNVLTLPIVYTRFHEQLNK